MENRTGEVLWEENINKKIFLLNIKNNCSNSCVFCTTKMVNGFTKNIKSENKQNIFNAIKYGAKKCFSKIQFVAVEPLEHPNIISLISYSNKLGFNEIKLLTNGKKFKDLYFLKKLIQAGLTEVEIPLFGQNERIHDSVSQTKGSFADMVNGLENLKKSPIKYSTHLIIVKQNFRHLLDVVDFCYKEKYNLRYFDLSAPSTINKDDYLKYIFKLSEIHKEIFLKKRSF